MSRDDITSNTIIVSMTSYPARINGVKSVLESMLAQRYGIDCHFVLVLATPEFPERFDSLPEDLAEYLKESDVEVIWYPRNILSHKKLMPTLTKYPNNPILVCDDDVIRPEGWLKMFADDHVKYPDSVIAGSISWFFSNNLELKRFDTFKPKYANTVNGIPDMGFRFARPANGLGGTLYPAKTFTDPRFFDEDLMMKLSPTSDESWQYCFEIMADAKIRQSSRIFDYSSTFINGSQNVPTALHKVNKYQVIFGNLVKEFPEFKDAILRRQKEVIVSFTTYKERLETGCVDKVVDSLLEQTWEPLKIVMTTEECNKQYISEHLWNYINSGKIELLTAEKNYRPHNKYFYTMLKYREYPIITVDDDIIYDKNVVECLMKSYISHPDCISARRVHKIMFANGKVISYNKWKMQATDITDPSHILFATGVGGVLYPPDILNISPDMETDIIECLCADDVYLKHLESKKGIKVVFAPNKRPQCTPIKDDAVQEHALYKSNVKQHVNDEYIAKFPICGRESIPVNVKRVVVHPSIRNRAISPYDFIGSGTDREKALSTSADVFSLKSNKTVIRKGKETNSPKYKLFY